jgi:hypothetical protein
VQRPPRMRPRSRLPAGRDATFRRHRSGRLASFNVEQAHALVAEFYGVAMGCRKPCGVPVSMVWPAEEWPDSAPMLKIHLATTTPVVLS